MVTTCARLIKNQIIDLKEALPWSFKLEGLTPNKLYNSTRARPAIANCNERCQKLFCDTFLLKISSKS